MIHNHVQFTAQGVSILGQFFYNWQKGFCRLNLLFGKLRIKLSQKIKQSLATINPALKGNEGFLVLRIEAILFFDIRRDSILQNSFLSFNQCTPCFVIANTPNEFAEIGLIILQHNRSVTEDAAD